ncbi:TetR/AcrR family transcriptional regulator [uncultured Gemella sp.]|uniref:TetR/AcrR family transcriptional regulator n=1 Tax=uncultured Gemella sp. TaxID=254352 RepID=UPI0025DCFB9D|nr:TetR family transcriptional regulator [uncultured Gemella sp.]
MAYKKKITKTQKKFEESLLKLMETKKFEAITVNDITELANFNRSTFYRHYFDKYELLEKIEDNILNDVLTYQSNIINNINKNEITKDFKLTDYVSPDKNFFIVYKERLNEIKILLGYNGSNSFRKKIRLTMLDFFKKSFNLANFNASNQEVELLFQFLVGSFVSILDYWTDNQELTPTELFLFYSSLMSNGVVNFLKDKMI